MDDDDYEMMMMMMMMMMIGWRRAGNDNGFDKRRIKHLRPPPASPPEQNISRVLSGVSYLHARTFVEEIPVLVKGIFGMKPIVSSVMGILSFARVRLLQDPYPFQRPFV